jgi:FkbM family methyltransferase
VLIKRDDHKEDVRLILDALDTSIERRGIIHVGAHIGEEVEAYLQAGFRRIVLIEANSECCHRMSSNFRGVPEISIHNCAISDHDGTVQLQLHTSRSGNTEPASILPLKRFKEIVPTLTTPRTMEVAARTLDSFLASEALSPEDFSVLNMDIQGAELKALAGATRLLECVQAVISEVAFVELYDGGASESEIVAFMQYRGFERTKTIAHTLYDQHAEFPAWGECLFVRPVQSSSTASPKPVRP